MKPKRPWCAWAGAACLLLAVGVSAFGPMGVAVMLGLAGVGFLLGMNF